MFNWKLKIFVVFLIATRAQAQDSARVEYQLSNLLESYVALDPPSVEQVKQDFGLLLDQKPVFFVRKRIQNLAHKSSELPELRLMDLAQLEQKLETSKDEATQWWIEVVARSHLLRKQVDPLAWYVSGASVYKRTKSGEAFLKEYLSLVSPPNPRIEKAKAMIESALNAKYPKGIPNEITVEYGLR